MIDWYLIPMLVTLLAFWWALVGHKRRRIDEFGALAMAMVRVTAALFLTMGAWLVYLILLLVFR